MTLRPLHPVCNRRTPPIWRTPVGPLVGFVLLALLLAGCSDDPAAPEEPTPIEEIGVEPGDLLLEAAETASLEIRVDGTLRSDLEAEPALVVESTDPAIARVVDGTTVEAMSPGEALIRVRALSNGVSTEIPVRVAAAGTTVSASGGTLSLAGGQLQLEVPADAVDRRVVAMAEPVSLPSGLSEDGAPGSGWSVAWADASGPAEVEGMLGVSVAFDPDELPAGVFPESLRLFSAPGAGTGSESPVLLPEAGARLDGPHRVRGTLPAPRLEEGVALVGVRPEPVGQLALGSDHVCTRSADDQLWCWGSHTEGALGRPEADDSPRPLPLPVEVRARALAAGEAGSCAVEADGTLWCWGRIAEDSGSEEPIAEFALDAPALELTVGTDHACALDDSGTLWCWGSNTRGQLGSEDAGGSGPRPVDQGDLDFISVAAGDETTLAVAEDQTLWMWGRGVATESNGSGTVAVEIRNSPPVAKAATGGNTACALDGEGQVWCWGSNDRGQLGQGPADDVSGVVSSEEASPVAFPDGTPPMADLAMAPGGETVCALDTDDSLWCWGRNDAGQVGVVTDSQCRSGEELRSCAPTPIQVEGLPPVGQVALGTAHSCAVAAEDGRLWCWGSNERGQFGAGADGSPGSGQGPVRAGGGR